MSRTTRILLVQAVFDGVAGQLDPVGDLQLAERRLHVVLDGAVAQRQPRGNLLGGQALGDVAQYLGLPLGQARRRRPSRAGALRDAPVLPQHQPGQARGEHRTPVSGRAHRVAEFLLRRALDQIAGGTCLHRLQDVVALVGGRQHQDPRRRRHREHLCRSPARRRRRPAACPSPPRRADTAARRLRRAPHRRRWRPR